MGYVYKEEFFYFDTLEQATHFLNSINNIYGSSAYYKRTYLKLNELGKIKRSLSC